MAISEDQLTTWATIGAQKTSKDTYATVKLALEDGDYGGRNYCSFLQGSYGNDTNIWKESDVDVVMELSANFYYDLSSISADEKAAFKSAHGSAEYDFQAFRTDVLAALNVRFGEDVVPGTKAIMIKANGTRRKADVLVALQHRKYLRYPVQTAADYITGISFFKTDGTKVVNYPRLHSQNMIAKNQSTGEWFKHLVRIFKNARQKLIADEAIAVGVAPSYYIEGLLYNVPNQHFGTSYSASMFECLSVLNRADLSTYLCANEQYPLLDGNADVTWNSSQCNAFIKAVVELWNRS